MRIFKKKQTKCTQENGGNEVREIRCDEVYVLTTEIISSHDDGSGWGPQCVTLYYLGTKKGGIYYELFSGKKLAEEKDTHLKDCVSKEFNVPYITKVEMLTKYLRDQTMKTIKLNLLFDFITDMNVIKIIESRSKEN